MTILTIKDDLAAQLDKIAQTEQRSVEDVLRSALQLYASLPQDSGTKMPMTSNEVLVSMDGMFDDEITDLSTTVRETMSAYYKKKYGDSD
jgi:hypothetical protein